MKDKDGEFQEEKRQDKCAGDCQIIIEQPETDLESRTSAEGYEEGNNKPSDEIENVVQ